MLRKAFSTNNQSSSFFERILGERMLIAVSWFFMLAGIAWLALLNVSDASWQVSGGLFVLGIGFGLLWTPACSFTMAACDAANQGFASGAIALSRSFFGVLGIAILGSLLAAGMATGIRNDLAAMKVSPAITHHVTKAVHHGGAFAVAEYPPAGISGRTLMPIVEQSFGRGWRDAMLFTAGLSLLFGIVIYALTPTRKTAASAAST